MAADPDAGRPSQGPLIGTAALVLGTFVVAMIGLRTAQPPVEWGDAAYRTLQLFALEGDALDGLRRPLNGWLEFARFAAPVAGILVAVVALTRLVGSGWMRRRTATMTGHVIVCGDGEAAVALARDIDGSGGRVVLVGASEVRVPGTGIRTVVGDAREPGTLRSAGVGGARALYACAEQSAVNAAVALAAGGLRTGGNARLATFAQVRSDDLVEALRMRRLATTAARDVSMDFFALDEIAARRLVAQHPVGSGTPTVIGFGPLGQAVVRAIVRGPGGGHPARSIVVVSAAPSDAVEREAVRLDAAARGWQVRHGREEHGDSQECPSTAGGQRGPSTAGGQVYVCLADEDEGIATGLRLGRADDRDVVVCLQRRSPFAQALDDAARLKIFGVLDEACREDAIADDSIVGRAARAIHRRYQLDAAARRDTLATNPSMVDWVDLPHHLQQSNIAQAEGIGAKLSEIRAGLATRPTAVPFAFADGEVLKLARIEHARWKKEREDAGFRWGPSRQGMEHPDLVDWSGLNDESRQKDIDAVEHLPELLATEGLYIRRDAG